MKHIPADRFEIETTTYGVNWLFIAAMALNLACWVSLAALWRWL